MLRTHSKAAKAQGASLSIIPIALLLMCVMGSIALVANRAATRQHHYELDRERRQLAQTFQAESELLLERLGRDDALGDIFQLQKNRDALERVLGAFNRRHGFDYSAVISRADGDVLAEIGEAENYAPRARDMRRLIDASRLRGIESSTIGIGREARISQDGMGLVYFVTYPFGKSLVLVAMRPVGANGLRRLANTLAISSLKVEPGWSTIESSLQIPGIDAVTRMSVVWEPSRRASETFSDLALFGTAGALIVCLVGVHLFRRIRHSTEEILRREAKANHEARHDSLSGLPNRAVFCETLGAHLEDLPNRDTIVAVLLLDLDKFKDINDSYGHAAGDRVLIDFGQRVRPLLKQTDLIARLGGDEFAVIQTGIRSHLDATRLAQAILDVAAAPFMLDGIAMRIGVTVGISIAPDDGTDMATILRNADTALYRAKNEGRNRFSLYEHRMTDAERMRKLVDDELRGAIERDELTLVYQPQVFADTGKIASVEALVRWRHPTQGLISPGLFIAAAEERGLIVPLGQWVMRRACRDAARWPGLRVGVNVSAIQFRQNDFVQNVARTLAEAELDAGALELELTEGVLVEDADQAEAAMMKLRSMGVKLALDDFGTGYSSLIYLRRFAFDKIKIDKSFLDALEASGESAILVHSVVHLGRALGLEVTAEGVEEEEQRRFLQAVGCHFLQGYLFSKPVPAETIDEMLKAERGEAEKAA